MNKNKKIIIGICIIALIVIVVLVVNLLKKSDSIISFSETEIERAYITNGNNGNVTEIKNENINLIYSNIKNMNVEEIEKNETSGWQYYIDFQLKDSTKRVIIVSSTVFENANKRFKVDKTDGNKLIQDILNIETNATTTKTNKK